MARGFSEVPSDQEERRIKSIVADLLKSFLNCKSVDVDRIISKSCGFISFDLVLPTGNVTSFFFSKIIIIK